LHGSTHLYRRKDKELQALASIPVAPDWLKGEAKLEWNRVTSKLSELGILTELDRAVLVSYCQTWADYMDALKYCKTSLVKTGQGSIVQNPAIGIKNRALQLLLRAAAELGMTPSSRASMVKPQENQEEKGAHFFKKWGPCGLS
jgi:P27 family predicted phage terminase small subunit